MAKLDEEAMKYGAIFSERFTTLCREHGFYGKKGIAQNDMAKALGTSSSTINRYQNGARAPEPAYLVRVSEYFKVSVDWLLGLVDDRTASAYQTYYPDKKQAAPEAEITDQQRELLSLYGRATENDKQIVNILLAKYK